MMSNLFDLTENSFVRYLLPSGSAGGREVNSTRCIGLNCYSSCYKYQAPSTGSPRPTPEQVRDNTLEANQWIITKTELARAKLSG